MVLIQLPAYSPDLNPIERLWQDLRYRLGSELPSSLHALREKTAAPIRACSPEQLASLCGYSYLLTLFHHAQQF